MSATVTPVMPGKETTAYAQIPAKAAPAFKVSAVIITYNEEQIIEKSLSKLHWCDEIIVVDSYSTDNTVAICKAHGCKVYTRHFDGYGPQKRFAISKASNDWVLSLDADEVLTDELAQEIANLKESDKQYAGFAFRMNMIFLNKEFTHGKESGRYFLRLFNRQHGGISNLKVHEGIQVSGPVKKLKHIVRHYSYTSVYQYFEKSNRYTTYSAEIAFKKGKRKPIPVVLLAFPYNFFKYYFLERNFMNGLKGFYWSALSTYSHFTKYIKLNELNQQGGRTNKSL
jgi:glycosyltransferase involved in cell wall biosynthesis